MDSSTPASDGSLERLTRASSSSSSMARQHAKSDSQFSDTFLLSLESYLDDLNESRRHLRTASLPAVHINDYDLYATPSLQLKKVPRIADYVDSSETASLQQLTSLKEALVAAARNGGVVLPEIDDAFDELEALLRCERDLQGQVMGVVFAGCMKEQLGMMETMRKNIGVIRDELEAFSKQFFGQQHHGAPEDHRSSSLKRKPSLLRKFWGQDRQPPAAPAPPRTTLATYIPSVPAPADDEKIEEPASAMSSSSPPPPSSGRKKDLTRNELIKHHKNEIAKMKKQHDAALQEKKDEIARLKKHHEQALQELKQQHEAALQRKKDEIRELRRKTGIPDGAGDAHYDSMRNKIAELLTRMDVVLPYPMGWRSDSERSLLVEKTREVEHLSSQLSDSSRRMSLHSIVVSKLLRQVEKLTDDFEDELAEGLLKDEVYHSIAVAMIEDHLSTEDVKLQDYQEQLSSLETLLSEKDGDLHSVIQEYQNCRIADELDIQDLKEKLSALEILLLETENSAALGREEIEELKEKLALEREHNLQYRGELAKLGRDLFNVSSALEHAESKITTLGGIIEDKNLTCQRNAEHEGELKHNIAFISAALEKSEKRNLDLDRLLEDMSQKNLEYQKSIAELNQKLESTASALEEAAERNSLLDSVIEEQKTSLQASNEENLRLETEISELKQSIEKISTALEESENRNLNLHNIIKGNETALVSLGEVTWKNSQYEEELSELEQTLETTSIALEELKKENRALRSSLEEKQNALLSLVELQQSMQQMSTALEESENRNTTLHDIIQEKEIALRTLTETTQKNSKYEAELNEIKQELQMASLALEESKKKICVLQHSVEEKQAALSQYKVELANLDNKLELALSALEEAEERNINLNSILCKMQSAISSYDEIAQKNMQYKAEVAELNQRLECSSNALEKAKEENDLRITEMKKCLESCSNALHEAQSMKLFLCGVIEEKESALLTFSENDKERRKQLEHLVNMVTELSKDTRDIDGKITENIAGHDNWKNDWSDQSSLLQQAIVLTEKGRQYQQYLETRCVELQSAEEEVQLLHDRVNTLIGILTRIHLTVDQYSSVFQCNPGLLDAFLKTCKLATSFASDQM